MFKRLRGAFGDPKHKSQVRHEWHTFVRFSIWIGGGGGLNGIIFVFDPMLAEVESFVAHGAAIIVFCVQGAHCLMHGMRPPDAHGPDSGGEHKPEPPGSGPQGGSNDGGAPPSDSPKSDERVDPSRNQEQIITGGPAVPPNPHPPVIIPVHVPEHEEWYT